MTLILVHPPSPADASMFDSPDNDLSGAPWIALRDAMKAIGVTMTTTYLKPDAIETANWVCFMNIPDSLKSRPFSVRACLSSIREKLAGSTVIAFDPWARLVRAKRTDHAALFLWEPVVVLPENFVPRLHQYFSRVFTWKKNLTEQGGRYRPIVWPQPSVGSIPKGASFFERKLLANFSGNKQSSHELELYTARLEVIRYMEAFYPESFDHYGPNWSADFSSWRGTVPDKLSVYPNYRFGLCYENMRGVRGYITEKIFDCLRSGVVPVYWGAADISQEVSPESFIDRRKFSSTSEMIAFIREMDEKTWLEMKQAGARYLESASFGKYLPPSFTRYVIEGLAY